MLKLKSLEFFHHQRSIPDKTMDYGNKLYKNIISAIPLLSIVFISFFFYFVFTPTSIVEYIGIENAYIMMFVVAMLSGLTTFNTVPYYSVLLILANSGLNPFTLGLFSAMGVIVGDSFSYFMGYKGGSFMSLRNAKIFNKILSLAQNHPKVFPIICFLYGSFFPLSNDLITIPAGIAGIPYRKVVVPLALGNIIFNITLSNLAVYIYPFVKTLIL